MYEYCIKVLYLESDCIVYSTDDQTFSLSIFIINALSLGISLSLPSLYLSSSSRLFLPVCLFLSIYRHHQGSFFRYFSFSPLPPSLSLSSSRLFLPVCLFLSPPSLSIFIKALSSGISLSLPSLSLSVSLPFYNVRLSLSVIS